SVIDADQLREDPARRSEDEGCVHHIWINIAADMANIAIVTDLVERQKRARDEHADAAITRLAGARPALERETCIPHVRRFRWCGCERARYLAVEDRVDDLAEAPGSQLCGCPPMFSVV